MQGNGKPLLTLEVFSTHLNITDLNEGVSKNIAFEDFLSLVKDSIEGFKVQLGGLYKIRYKLVEITFKEPGGIRNVLIFHKHNKFDMKTKDRTYKGIEHPSLLFLFKLKNTIIFDTFVVAVKDISQPDEITDSTPIYRYPYAHVNNSFGICWGYSFPEITSLHQISSLPSVFLEGGEHNFSHGMEGNYKSKLKGEKLMEALESGKVKLDSIMVKTGLTYNEFVKKYM